MIQVSNLNKVYQVPQREKGMKGFCKHIIKPNYKSVNAVSNVNFSIKEGEIVGFLGPNGAGKSTTIKMLSGILVPTDGEITVNGNNPYTNRKINSKNIGIVLGHKTQLWWNLPLQESFEMLRTIYKIKESEYKKNLEMFNEILQMEEFLTVPVRQLSLGQRMRAEIAASLIHDPKVIYLDEPTIGLDVVAKQKIREFIKESNKLKKNTIILTTHDMKDVEEICERIIIINKGSLIYDGNILGIKSRYESEKTMRVKVKKEIDKIELQGCNVINQDRESITLAFANEENKIMHIINQIEDQYGILDISVSDIEVEEIIRRIYTS